MSDGFDRECVDGLSNLDLSELGGLFQLRVLDFMDLTEADEIVGPDASTARDSSTILVRFPPMIVEPLLADCAEIVFQERPRPVQPKAGHNWPPVLCASGI